MTAPPAPAAASSACRWFTTCCGVKLVSTVARSLVAVGLAVISTAAATGQEAPASADDPSPVSSTAGSGDAIAAEQLEFFEKQVRPLLVTHCYECHSGASAKLQAGLRLDHREGFLIGGDSGPSIVPGDAQASLLIDAIRYESYEMPPKGKLDEREIEVFEQWVDRGAVWPDEAPPELATPASAFDISERTAHWAWQPLASVTPPAVQDTQWPQSPIDQFILHDLEAAGLSPALPLDRQGLIRRLFFDLLGIPPTAEQVDAFLADTSPTAVERLVDSLLQSPQFGERWGRHWLDLVRYAESRGHEFDNDADNAYQYRDYVIRGLNADVPYDQWVIEHLAGDLLSTPRLNPHDGSNESVLGTGFWFLGEWVHSPVDIRKDEADRFDNMIDVLSKAFLGVTVACARCHDHKFDAISTADYYALSGFLQSSDYRQVRFDTIEHNRRIGEQLAQLDQAYRQQVGSALAAHPLASTAPVLPARQLTSVAAPIVGDASESPAPQPHYVLVDYERLAAEDYLQDGQLFGPGPRRPGDLFLATGDDEPRLRVATHHAATSDPFWKGLVSHHGPGVQLHSRLRSLPMSGRTLRTPTVLLQHGQVVCQVRGGGHIVACVDSHRLVAGPLHGETIVSISPSDQWQWVSLNLDRYVGHRLHLEFVPDENAVLEVAMITQGASPEQRAQLLRRQQAAAQTAEQLAAWLEQVWADQSPASEQLRQLVAQWAAERASLRQQVRTQSRLAMAMSDGSGEEDHVLIRGNAAQPGPLVPRRFLSAIDGEQPLEINTRSGRLELAARINDPANPLTHRVIVNRIWHYLLGRGIVATPDDFGVLGQLPTHPPLLDHLAERFLQDGRSIKRMIRYIVLSKTYQMSSRADAEALQRDPKNLLWHHRPPKRLEGEAIRDALLVISGRLDAAMHGPSVPIHLTSFMEGRGRPAQSGPADGDGRRSVYIAVRRNFLSPFMLAFDTPVPFSTMGRRNVSNVPAQALILMNDPFVVEQAQQWAQRVLQTPGEALLKSLGQPPAETMDREKVAAARVGAMYRAAFARPPQPQELAAALDYLLPAETDDPVAASNDWSARWADFAHALINTKEFIFLR